MKLTSRPLPAMSRALALGAALVLALACLADVAHAGGKSDGCPQAKLEAQRSPSSFVDTVLLPVRIELRKPAVFAPVVPADRSHTAPPVFARRAAPRAPPIA